MMAGLLVPAGSCSCARSDMSSTAAGGGVWVSNGRGVAGPPRAMPGLPRDPIATQRRSPSPLPMPTSRSLPSLASELKAWQVGKPYLTAWELSIRLRLGSCGSGASSVSLPCAPRPSRSCGGRGRGRGGIIAPAPAHLVRGLQLADVQRVGDIEDDVLAGRAIVRERGYREPDAPLRLELHQPAEALRVEHIPPLGPLELCAHGLLVHRGQY
jgi:hypothetical protein